MTPIRTRSAVLVAAAFAALVASSIASPQAGVTMEGEELFVQAEGVTVNAECDTEGNSTVSWTAAGLAFGPYPGTFTAGGTITIGPQTVPGQHPPGPDREGTVAGPVLSFEESFTIESGTTTITGTKTLFPGASIETGTLGTCQHVSQFPILDFSTGEGRVVEVQAHTQYEATIEGATGTSTDSGLAFVSLGEIDITGSCPTGTCHARIGGFSQTFALSDQHASTPGHANGGGQVMSLSGDKVTFAFHGRRDAAGSTGACSVVDHLTGRHIRCITVDSYSQVGGHVSITGEAVDSGVPTSYTIEADDNGEPNRGTDTFTIDTGTGYVAGGTVSNGEVQVR